MPADVVAPWSVVRPEVSRTSTCDVRPLERSGCHQGDSTAVEGWVPGSVQGLSPPRRASRVTAGCEARGQGPRTLVPSEGYRLGKSGRVNANESSMMPRQASSRRWVAPAGGRDWPQQSGRRRLDRARRSGAHRRPRGSEDTQPGRSSLMRNTTTPMRSGRPVRLVSRPQGRPILSGRRKIQQANAGGRKEPGNRVPQADPPSAAPG